MKTHTFRDDVAIRVVEQIVASSYRNEFGISADHIAETAYEVADEMEKRRKPATKTAFTKGIDWGSNRPFDSAEFLAAWENWVKHRKEIKKPLTQTQGLKQLALMGKKGERWAIDAMNYTIEKGWQGLQGRPDGHESTSPSSVKLTEL